MARATPQRLGFQGTGYQLLALGLSELPGRWRALGRSRCPRPKVLERRPGAPWIPFRHAALP
eukprot:4508037-Alexandrium_andersonii.AAC.1